MKHFYYLILILCLTVGCQSAITTQQTSSLTPEVGLTVIKEPQPSPIPATCTSLPDEMTLQVEPLGQTEALVELTGLQPGESLLVIFMSTTPGYQTTLEHRPIEVVGQDGRFTYRRNNLTQAPQSEINGWEVKVIHAGGVACTEVILP